MLDYYILTYQYQKGLTERLSSTLVDHAVGEPAHRGQHHHHPPELRVEAEIDITKT